MPCLLLSMTQQFHTSTESIVLLSNNQNRIRDSLSNNKRRPNAELLSPKLLWFTDDERKKFYAYVTQHCYEKPLFTLFNFFERLYIFLHKINNRITSHIFCHITSFVKKYAHLPYCILPTRVSKRKTAWVEPMVVGRVYWIVKLCYSLSDNFLIWIDDESKLFPLVIYNHIIEKHIMTIYD